MLTLLFLSLTHHPEVLSECKCPSHLAQTSELNIRLNPCLSRSVSAVQLSIHSHACAN